jgi:threonine dehydratase
MPDDSVTVKVEAAREFGGSVELVDTLKITRVARVAELAREYPGAYVASGFDDELMIAGNSTLGRELARLNRGVDVIVAPVNAGGLASGILKGLRSEGADIPWIGAEPLLANHVTRSFRAGQIVVDKEESKDESPMANHELGRAQPDDSQNRSGGIHRGSGSRNPRRGPATVSLGEPQSRANWGSRCGCLSYPT